MPRFARPRALLTVTALLLVLTLSGCDEGDIVGPIPNASMNWSLQDDCIDGHGIQAKLFDFTHDVVWPGRNQVYFADAGDAIDVTIGCERGAQVCFGAETDPATDIFWGVGLDGFEDCDDCCDTCDDFRIEFSLVCDQGAARTVRVR